MRKAREREASIRKEEVEKCEKENYFSSYALLPAIAGILVFGGYFFFQRKKDQQPDNNNNEKPSENSHLENF